MQNGLCINVNRTTISYLIGLEFFVMMNKSLKNKACNVDLGQPY